MAATATIAAAAPSDALARSRHRAVQAPTPRETAVPDRNYRYGTGPGGAFNAVPGASSSYPGYGYGYGDNSHGCSACN